MSTCKDCIPWEACKALVHAWREIEGTHYPLNAETSENSCIIKEDTIDESPFAYKPIDQIVNNIDETVEIINRIKPIYNFKAN